MAKTKRAAGRKSSGSAKSEVSSAFALGAVKLRRFGDRDGASPPFRTGLPRRRIRRGPGQHG